MFEAGDTFSKPSFLVSILDFGGVQGSFQIYIVVSTRYFTKPVDAKKV